jgi:hypothetical protein
MPPWRLLEHLRDLSLTDRFTEYHRYCLAKRGGQSLDFEAFIDAFKSLLYKGLTPDEVQKVRKLLSSAFEPHQQWIEGELWLTGVALCLLE